MVVSVQSHGKRSAILHKLVALFMHSTFWRTTLWERGEIPTAILMRICTFGLNHVIHFDFPFWIEGS